MYECYAYMVCCCDGTLYAGWTNDLKKRLSSHNAGTGAKYTRSRRPVTLVYFERFYTREEAMRRERQLKSLKRPEKLALIRGFEAEKQKQGDM